MAPFHRQGKPRLDPVTKAYSKLAAEAGTGKPDQESQCDALLSLKETELREAQRLVQKSRSRGLRRN